MTARLDNPLIVQGDGSLLLDVRHARYDAARATLAGFADLVASPETLHTYQITPLSLWNAAAAGEQPAQIVAALAALAQFDLPEQVVADIRDFMGRYGQLQLVQRDDALVLIGSVSQLVTRVWQSKRCRPLLLGVIDATALEVDPAARGQIKHALLQLGYPVVDHVGYAPGAVLDIALCDRTQGGRSFTLRSYQQAAVQRFATASSGSGVVVLPCGAGKTLVGIAAVARLGTQTLVLCPNTVAVRQWRDELLDKTTLTPDQIGEYTGEYKQVRPVTIATYQVLTQRGTAAHEYPHFALFDQRDWGLVIYDEVHMLPAPVFRMTAAIQSRRRLGLTATLVREDGREREVFSLIGPKCYEVAWRDLERDGWIATVVCTEVRLDLPPELYAQHMLSDDRRAQYRIAAENPAKFAVVERLVAHHWRDYVLVIGQYLDQLQQVAQRLDAPLITGGTKTAERERLYGAFRRGEITVLVVSKVANVAIDLPDANVVVQLSGSFGSRQEEAQRLGRILRPKADGAPAHFYTLVTRDTREQEFAAHRQLFLAEQGYRYGICNVGDLAEGGADQ